MILTTNFTAYIIPYLVVVSQSITCKLSSSEIFSTSPVTATDLQFKYTAQTAKIKERFDSLRVTYKETTQSGGLVSKDTSTLFRPSIFIICSRWIAIEKRYHSFVTSGRLFNVCNVVIKEKNEMK